MDVHKNSIARFSCYRDVLSRFKSYNVSWIYSGQIASAVGTTAAQVRKDFSLFKVAGKRKSGYEIDTLIDAINRIIGKNKKTNAILVYANESLGNALYDGYFSQDPTIHIAARFTATPSIPVQSENEKFSPVYPVTSLVGYITEHAIRYGIIAIPDASAQKIIDMMIIAGIKGLLCITAAELKSPKNCTVRSINPLRELEAVMYFTKHHS